MIIVGRKTQILAPGFRPDTAAIEILIQQTVIESVVAQQPVPGDPTLPDTEVADQAVILLGDTQLAPGEIAGVVL